MIPHIKKILYATDLSKNSVYAFYFAIDMAKKYDAEIYILHVVEHMVATFGGQTVNLNKDKPGAAIAEIKTTLHNFCNRVEEKNNLACVALVDKIFVHIGDPVHEILKAADEEKCDLIVLGNHGKGFVARAIMGNVARSVMDKARIPVFLIPLPAEDNLALAEI
ncbi:MAG TPA: universal stress protein [Smithellaceae bacterium]|nr:universal stress protein [Smithellaceae bacterium]